MGLCHNESLSDYIIDIGSDLCMETAIKFQNMKQRNILTSIAGICANIYP